MSNKYRRITEKVLSDSDDFLNGDIDIVIQNLQDLKAKHSDYSKLEISLDAGYNNISMEVIGHRNETDTERNSRLAIEKKAKEVNNKKLAAKKLKIIQEAKKLGLKLSE
jgi:hypothetical protein